MRVLVRVAAVLGKFLGGTALALAVFLAGTYFHVRGALPSYSGTLELAGLKAPVEIIRDKNAVPHITARTPRSRLATSTPRTASGRWS